MLTNPAFAESTETKKRLISACGNGKCMKLQKDADVLVTDVCSAWEPAEVSQIWWKIGNTECHVFFLMSNFLNG